MWCMIWTVYDWLNKFYNFLMAAIVSIIIRSGLRIKMHHKNQRNKTKMILYRPLFHIKGHLNQLHISNKLEYFSFV